MGLLGSIGKFLSGRKSRREQVQRFTPQQQQALNQLLSTGMQNLDPQALEDRYTKQFEEQTIPGIAQQFTTSGGQRSGAFRSALGRAGGDLASQLAALRSQRGMQQAQMGLTQQFDTVNTPGSQGFLGKNAGPLGDLFGQLLFGGGGAGQQPQQQGGGPLYFGGQPQGFNIRKFAPMALKMILGSL